MKFNPNLIKRINEQIKVWSKNVPSVLNNLKNKMESKGILRYGKKGNIIFSRKNMGEDEYKKTKDVIDYYLKNIKSYSEKYKDIKKMLKEQGNEKPSKEEINKMMEIQKSYSQLVDEMFKTVPSDISYDMYKKTKNMSVEESTEIIEDFLNNYNGKKIDIESLKADNDNPFE